MLFKAILLVLVMKVKSEESEATCDPQPTCQCNCGSAETFPTTVGNNKPSNTAQGRPGRVGPRGPAGPTGPKGERGQTEDTRAELVKIQTQLDELKNVTNELQKEADRQRLLNSKTCSHIYGFSNHSSGIYRLTPNGEQIEVFCNFSENSQTEAETIIYHNFPLETDAGNCESARCARHAVTYDLTMTQIAAVIEASSECRQYIKYRCVQAVLLGSSSSTIGAWLSRDGSTQTYWGGATSRRSGYCACGETGSCESSNRKCNCDKNATPETSDEGFLTDKDKLPVTGLQFGDLGDRSSGERGWFTLGPLICSGQAD